MTRPIRIDHFVDGERISGTPVSRIVNPSDLADVVAESSEAGGALVDLAFEAAARAATRWRASGIGERAAILYRIGADIAREAERLAAELSREEGKLLADARAEARKAAEIFRYYGGIVQTLDGQFGRRLSGNAEVLVSREPRGVIGLITPWNAPLAIVSWKLAPAIATGNAVVLKPSEKAPVSVQSLMTLIVAAIKDLGAPAGLVNLVSGGLATGQSLVRHPGLDALSFTGGSAAGSAIASEVAPRLLPLQLELGGKNALVVARDADLERAAALVVSGGFAGAGQKCTATSRVIVEAPVADAFAELLAVKVSALVTGRADDPAVFMGPVVDAEAVARTAEARARAERAGGRCVAQGRACAGSGHFVPACLIAADDPKAWINQTELFAPVVSLIPVPDLDAAIDVANATPYGLSSAIATRSLKSAYEFRRRCRSGIVAVNQTTSGSDLHAPFEGTKHSGLGGAEQGTEALRFFTHTKTAYILND
jgi:acyl-CoA reductase-like NAD-dependent aldehyde dehydrogenase